jgi:hypothetical protein
MILAAPAASVVFWLDIDSKKIAAREYTSAMQV